MYRCGPASLEAIRRGEVGYLYDTKFTFAAVNSDVLHFQEDRESTWGFSRLNFDECHVGKKLVTKKVGVDDDDENSCNDMEDVTYLYKSPEGSDAERMAVYNAIRSEEQSRRHYDVALAEEEDVVFILEEIETVRFGEPFKIFVKIENKSDQKRTIKATMAAHSVFYTGHTAHVLKKAAGKIVLEPKQSENMFISVSAEQYLEKTVDHNMIKIYAIANVKETKQNWSKEDDFPLLKPSLTVSISGNLKVGSECVAAFTFTNPINRLLTSCVISVEGPGLQRPKTQDFRDVQPYETVTFTEAFVPKRGGSRKIMASFNSKLLTGVNGSTTVEVQE